MASKRNKKRQQQNESKLIYVPFAVLAAIIVAIFVIPSLVNHSSSSSSSLSTGTNTVSPSSTAPFFAFGKVSNQDFAPSSGVAVYMISWYGCPLGAANSWALYLALSHYGVVNATPNWSDQEPLSNTYSGRIPGLLFNGFSSNSSVKFYPIYILGKIFLNNQTATLTNGTLISWSQILPIEQNELKSDLNSGLIPSGIYNLIEEYQLQQSFPGSTEPIAYLGNPQHITTMIIITGPNGTWMLIQFPQSIANGNLPLVLSQSGYTPQQIFQAVSTNNLSTLSSNVASAIENETQMIEQIINEAS